MKPPAFTYHRPDSVEQALRVLGEVGSDGKVLAGGQSLVPILNMRLAAPAHLVDINRLSALAYVKRDGDVIKIGALARHAQVQRDAPLPLLREATAAVAHPAIRNRGTTVGSLVHADPAAELPAVLSLVDGSVLLASATGKRVVPAAEFFTGPLESAVRPGELAIEASFPVPPPGTGSAWLEVSRRHGDYAVCGVGALVTVDPDGKVVRARAAYISVGPTPVVVDLTEAAPDWDAAGRLAASTVDPPDDIHATAAYRRHLVRVLTARAFAAAYLGIAVEGRRRGD
jgi:carbon-monoxide dehydrogenase medium subunit